jgi:hypothetical protein
MAAWRSHWTACQSCQDTGSLVTQMRSASNGPGWPIALREAPRLAAVVSRPGREPALAVAGQVAVSDQVEYPAGLLEAVGHLADYLQGWGSWRGPAGRAQAESRKGAEQERQLLHSRRGS